MFIFNDPIVDGSGEGLNFTQKISTGGIIALIAIGMVFAILAIIIFVTWFINAGVSSTGKLFKKRCKKSENPQQNPDKISVDLNDEDATVAVLVASIDYRNETHKNVKVISVKEIK